MKALLVFGDEVLDDPSEVMKMFVQLCSRAGDLGA